MAVEGRDGKGEEKVPVVKATCLCFWLLYCTCIFFIIWWATGKGAYERDRIYSQVSQVQVLNDLMLYSLC